tara:strand:+ start:64 stop:171 length:108 start_codon:yes stop_codon:yes gene_type:complete
VQLLRLVKEWDMLEQLFQAEKGPQKKNLQHSKQLE